jgi:hypothetical protein
MGTAATLQRERMFEAMVNNKISITTYKTPGAIPLQLCRNQNTEEVLNKKEAGR